MHYVAIPLTFQPGLVDISFINFSYFIIILLWSNDDRIIAAWISILLIGGTIDLSDTINININILINQ